MDIVEQQPTVRSETRRDTRRRTASSTTYFRLVLNNGKRSNKGFTDGEVDLIAFAESEADWQAGIDAHRST